MLFPKKCPACKNSSLTYDEKYIFCTSCPIYNKPLNLIQKPVAWARNRRYWWWRIPLLALVIYLLKQNLSDPSYAMKRSGNPILMFDFGVHELGHYLFMFFGEFMHILGGSLFQCLFPIIWLLIALKKKWYFASALCWGWLGINLFDVAIYAGDARSRMIPLNVGFSIFGIDPAHADSAYDSAHDWYQLLSRTGHLSSDLAIAHGLRVAGTICFIIGITISSLLLLQMATGSLQRLSRRKK